MMIADTVAGVLVRDPVLLPAAVPPVLPVTLSETLTAPPSATNGAIVILTSGTVPTLLLRTGLATPLLLGSDMAEQEEAEARVVVHGSAPRRLIPSKSTLMPLLLA